MEKNNVLVKILTNKIVLLLIPFLLVLSKYFVLYTKAPKYAYVFVASELVWYFLIVFVVFIGINLLMNLISKNRIISFYLMLLLAIVFYRINSTADFCLFALLLVLLSFGLRKIKVDEKGVLVMIPSMFCLFFILFSFIPALVMRIDLFVNTDRTVVNYYVKVENKDIERPNIYYIHCDGMMSMEAMNRYFGYDDKYLNDYLEDNKFLINRDVELVLGHKTQTALTALFNPYYYDNKEKAYLEKLEEYYDNPKSRLNNYITYQEMRDKRLNSELLRGLSKVGYTTYEIGPYDRHSVLNTDYFYDYYYFAVTHRHIRAGLKLRKFDKNYDKKILQRYLNIQLLIDTYPNGNDKFRHVDFSKYLKDVEFVKPMNLDLSNYEYLGKTTNEKVLNALYGLEDIKKNNDKNKFVFINYDLAHLYAAYDRNGNEIDYKEKFKIAYKENYMYDSYLLADLVKYIKNYDDNALIILQADHGIHVMSCENISKEVGVKIDECKHIRNSTFSSIYIPKKYKNGDEEYLSNPLNISRYLVNNYVGHNYEYIK